LTGQIPTYEEGDLARFETGSIVFHIAERHAGLLPDAADARARAITWVGVFVQLTGPDPSRGLGVVILLLMASTPLSVALAS
jgi:glutathione S-transferase